MNSSIHRLPARVQLTDGEALDSFLERVAVANELTAVDMVRLLDPRPGSGSLLFALVQPSNELLGRIELLTALGIDDARSATLQRFAYCRPLDFSGFEEPSVASFRVLSARGWFPLQGTQVCPKCLRSGRWLIEWRLPHIAVCDTHVSYLVPSCEQCGQRFRSRRASPLRPDLSAEQLCGNPLGPRRNCRHSVLMHSVTQAPPTAVEASKAVREALAGIPQQCLGVVASPELYLAELRALTVLLMHIATRSAPDQGKDWARRLRVEAGQRRTELRGPRWGIRPADDPEVRGEAIAAAHEILTASTIDEAAALLDPWITHIPNTQAGQAAWIRNRTPHAPMLGTIVEKCLHTNQSPSRQLEIRIRTDLDDSRIPQVIPADIYEKHVAPIMRSRSTVGRRFISLCLAKIARPGRSWTDSAVALGFQAEIGPKTARAVTKFLNLSESEFAGALEYVVEALDRDTDYRRIEFVVRTLASEPETWFPDWASSQNPRRRGVALPYAITWMWSEVAHADIETSPGWVAAPTSKDKAYFRAFCERLQEPAKSGLRTVVIAAN